MKILTPALRTEARSSPADRLTVLSVLSAVLCSLPHRPLYSIGPPLAPSLHGHKNPARAPHRARCIESCRRAPVKGRDGGAKQGERAEECSFRCHALVRPKQHITHVSDLSDWPRP